VHHHPQQPSRETVRHWYSGRNILRRPNQSFGTPAPDCSSQQGKHVAPPGRLPPVCASDISRLVAAQVLLLLAARQTVTGAGVAAPPTANTILHSLYPAGHTAGHPQSGSLASFLSERPEGRLPPPLLNPSTIQSSETSSRPSWPMAGPAGVWFVSPTRHAALIGRWGRNASLKCRRANSQSAAAAEPTPLLHHTRAASASGGLRATGRRCDHLWRGVVSSELQFVHFQPLGEDRDAGMGWIVPSLVFRGHLFVLVGACRACLASALALGWHS